MRYRVTTIRHGSRTRTRPGRRQKHSVKRDHFAFHIMLRLSRGQKRSEVIPHDLVNFVTFASTPLYLRSVYCRRGCLNCLSFVFWFPHTASSIATQAFPLPRFTVLLVLVLSTKEGGHRAAARALRRRWGEISYLATPSFFLKSRVSRFSTFLLRKMKIYLSNDGFLL